jgi:hypothetical protein
LPPGSGRARPRNIVRQNPVTTAERVGAAEFERLGADPRPS